MGMKINEVEALVGITKKNIRFYEEQGLLSPRRNTENSYRDYSNDEIQTLFRIKLLRKLGVPIGEIRNMLKGNHTVADGMCRHLVSLEREQRNLEQTVSLCRQIQDLDVPVTTLDAKALLEQMDILEQSGTTFQNKQAQDMPVRYIAPIIITLIMVALMIGLSGLLVRAYRAEPEGAPPVWFLLLCIGIFAAIGCGVVLALGQRIREIGKGEMDDAKRY